MNFVSVRNSTPTLSTDPTTGYSTPLDTRYGSKASFQIISAQTSGSFAVTTTVWASNKEDPNPDDDSDWVDISSLCTVPTVAGNSNQMLLIPVAGCTFRKVRVKVVRTSGDGTVTFFGAAKQ